MAHNISVNFANMHTKISEIKNKTLHTHIPTLRYTYSHTYTLTHTLTYQLLVLSHGEPREIVVTDSVGGC